MCFICNDHNFIILFWFTNASLDECLMIWMLNELCNNTVDLSWYIVTYVIFTYIYTLLVWLYGKIYELVCLSDDCLFIDWDWGKTYTNKLDILPPESQVQHTANLLHLNLLLLHEYTWLNLRKVDFHAHSSKTHFSPSNDSYTH